MKRDPERRRLRKRRRRHLRIARRAHQRRKKALRRGDREQAQNALKVYRRHREAAQQALNDIRARRTSLRYRLKFGPGKDLVWFDGRQVVPWIAEICARVRATGKWRGRVTSGYRSTAIQWIIYYVRRIRPAAKPGTSNHEKKGPYPEGAIDTNDPAGFREGLRQIGETRLQGYKIPNDPWHWSKTGY